MGLSSREKQTARRERLAASGVVQVSFEVPRDVSAQADRIVRLIGQGYRACQDPVAEEALQQALDAVYGLAGQVAAWGPPSKRKRLSRKSRP